jgi:ribosomal protein S18 acetylase RimI-like enzyme
MRRLTPSLCAQAAKDFNRRGLCPAPFSMRPATLENLDEILHIGQTCFSYNAPTRTEIRHMLTKAHGAIVGLCDGDVIAGYMLVEAHAGRGTIYFNTTALLPAYRGRGLGNLLYEFADFLAKTIQAKALWCHVAVNNDLTIHLLKKNGYGVSRTETEYYDDGRSAYVMRKAVSS